MISVGFCWNWAAASSIGPLRQFGFFMGTCITATQLHSDLRMGWNHFTPNYIILYLGVLTVLTSIYRLIQVVQAILMFTRVPGFWCIATWFWPSCLDQNANHTAAQRWFAWWVQMVLDVPSLDDHQEAYLLWVGSKHVQNAIGAEVNWVIVATLYPLVLVNHERSIAGWAYRLFRRWSGYASNFGKVQRGWTLTPVHDIFRAIHMRGACRIRPTTVGNMSSLAPFALAGGPGCTQTSQEGSGLGLEQTALSDGVMAWQREIMGHIWSQRVESHHVTAFSRRHAHHGIAMVKSSWWFSIQDVDVQDEDGRCWATRDGEGPRDVRRTMFFFQVDFMKSHVTPSSTSFLYIMFWSWVESNNEWPAFHRSRMLPASRRKLCPCSNRATAAVRLGWRWWKFIPVRVSITFGARICFECIGVYKLLPTRDRFQNETGRNQNEKCKDRKPPEGGESRDKKRYRKILAWQWRRIKKTIARTQVFHSNMNTEA